MKHRNTMFKDISDSMVNNAFELDYSAVSQLYLKYFNCFAVIS